MKAAEILKQFKTSIPQGGELVYKVLTNNNNTAIKKAGGEAGKTLKLTLTGELSFRRVWQDGKVVEGKFTPFLNTEEGVTIPITEGDERLKEVAAGTSVNATVSEYQNNFFIGVGDWEIAD